MEEKKIFFSYFYSLPIKKPNLNQPLFIWPIIIFLFFLFNCAGKWVLVISVENGHKTYYIVGDFDKEKFQFINYGELRLIDFGRDYYAPQIYNGLQDTIAIGWMQNWDSPRESFGNSQFAGAMTLPRKFTLDPNSNLLIQSLIPEILQGLRKTQQLLFEKIYELKPRTTVT